MSSRDTILGTIRTALGDTPSPERPPTPHVWPDTNPSVQQMADRFAEELEAVTGELHRCASMDEAKTKLSELLAELGCKSIGSLDRPELREEIDALAECVDALEPELAAVIRLRYVEARTTRGIAELIGLSESSVRLRLTNAARLLELCLKKKGVLK